MEDDNVDKPTTAANQPPMFTNIAAIKKTLAETANYSDAFTIQFEGADIAAGCDVTILDKRQAPLARARTVVPGRPLIDKNSGAVYLEVFFSNLRIVDGPDQKFSITVAK